MLLLNRQRVRYWRNSAELDTQCHSRASILAGEDTPSTREGIPVAVRGGRTAARASSRQPQLGVRARGSGGACREKGISRKRDKKTPGARET